MSDKKAIAAARFKEKQAAGKKRFKLAEGDTTFRVLPNALGTDKSEFAEYKMHQNVGTAKGYLRCGKNKKGEGDCWLCDQIIPKLEKSDKSAKRKLAELLAPKDVFAVQVAVKGADDNWAGPYLWEMPYKLSMQLLGMLAKRDLTNPEKGFNLTVTRTGTGFTDTRYEPIDRDEDSSEAPENVMAKLKPFKEVLKKYDEENTKNTFYGQEQEEDAEEETTKKKPAEEEESEEVEETPKKKPATKKPAEEEEEVSEESEEEETPKKPAAKKPVETEDSEELDDVKELEESEYENLVSDSEEEEEAAPPPKKGVKAKPASEPDEEEPEQKPKKASAKPKATADEEEEAEPPAKPAKKAAPAKKPVASSDEEEEY